jgi:hypothetical protein
MYDLSSPMYRHILGSTTLHYTCALLGPFFEHLCLIYGVFLLLSRICFLFYAERVGLCMSFVVPRLCPVFSEVWNLVTCSSLTSRCQVGEPRAQLN